MNSIHPATRSMRRHLLKLIAGGALAGAGFNAQVNTALAAVSHPKRSLVINRAEGERKFIGHSLKVGDLLSSDPFDRHPPDQAKRFDILTGID